MKFIDGPLRESPLPPKKACTPSNLKKHATVNLANSPHLTAAKIKILVLCLCLHFICALSIISLLFFQNNFALIHSGPFSLAYQQNILDRPV